MTFDEWLANECRENITAEQQRCWKEVWQTAYYAGAEAAVRELVELGRIAAGNVIAYYENLAWVPGITINADEH